MNEHLDAPKYSFWPLLLALAVGLVAVGVVSSLGVSVVGLLLIFASIIGWTWENRTESQEEESD